MKAYQYIFLTSLTLVPALTFAATPSLQKLLTNILLFINSTLIPFLFGIAFLFFAINVVRYFVAGAGNKDVREDAKNVALYSVMAFVFLVIFWGIVNMLVSSSGLQGDPAPCPDYMIGKVTGC